MASTSTSDKNINVRSDTVERKLLYRQLLNKIQDIEGSQDVSLQTVNETGDILKEINLLGSEWDVKETSKQIDEIFLDSLVLSSTSSVLKKCVESLDVYIHAYNPTEFAERICDAIKEENSDTMEPFDLLKLLGVARKIIPEVPDYTYIYGSYDLDNLPELKPKPKKERVKSQREVLERKEPEKVTNLDKEEETIEEILKEFNNVLNIKYKENKEEPIKYWDYIIDNKDFARTVENMFYFSFLIRDGRANIDLDAKGEPIIAPVDEKTLKQFRSKGGINSQIISQLSVQRWKEFKKPGFLQKHRKAMER